MGLNTSRQVNLKIKKRLFGFWARLLFVKVFLRSLNSCFLGFFKKMPIRFKEFCQKFLL